MNNKLEYENELDSLKVELQKVIKEYIDQKKWKHTKCNRFHYLYTLGMQQLGKVMLEELKYILDKEKLVKALAIMKDPFLVIGSAVSPGPFYRAGEVLLGKDVMDTYYIFEKSINLLSIAEAFRDDAATMRNLRKALEEIEKVINVKIE
jgi:hypothetical protein